MENRRRVQENKDKIQTAAAGRRNMSLNDYRVQKKQKKTPTEARREKKGKQRAKKAATELDAMEIG